jgi:2-hydroxychromene-2-carboxylate isomerase
MKKIEFYFDFLSPFSYFAWLNHREQLTDAFKNIELVYKPVLMGKLFSHFEFPGPGEITVKRNYELKKCFRYAAKSGIKFCPPSQFPFNPLAIIRLATLSAAGIEQIAVIDLIFKSVWANGKVLEDPELVKDLLIESGIKDAGEIFESAFAVDAKRALKANIKAAIAKNIFGVPTFAIDNEYFWGNDSIEDLKNYLCDNDSWDKKLYNKLTEK